MSSLETFTRQASPLDFVELAKEFHVDFKTLTGLISWAVFALGVSNLFWMPTALCVGKRPVILTSMVEFLAGTAWSIKATSFNSLLGSRIVATFGAGSVEALGLAIIAGKLSLASSPETQNNTTTY